MDIVSNLTVNEGNAGTTAATFNVTLSAASAKPITVNYATADGTAQTNGTPSDYTALPLSTLTFNPGQTTQTITVNVKGDLLNEPDETFFVNLTNATNATIGTAQSVATIVNDDAVPGLSIANVTQNEGTGANSTFVFNVTLNAPSAKVITVDYVTRADTALDAATPTSAATLCHSRKPP